MSDKLLEAEKRIETAEMKGRKAVVMSMHAENALAEAKKELSKAKELLEEPCIRLTAPEIQSGLDRVKWAENLIRQLPEDHDGRNSWLLNYGKPQTRNGFTIPGWEQLAKLGVLVERYDRVVNKWDKCYLREVKDSTTYPFTVNKLTKELDPDGLNNFNTHTCRLIPSNALYENPGHQPVPDKVRVEVVFETHAKGNASAGECDWSYVARGARIIAFRIMGVEE